MTVLLYVWRHSALRVDEYETAEQAIHAAVPISDYGNGAPHGVEDGDKWITPSDKEWKTIEHEIWQRQDAEIAKRPPMTHVVEVRAPDGQWAQYSGFASLEDAVASAERFQRSRVRTVGPLSQRQTVWQSAALQGDS